VQRVWCRRVQDEFGQAQRWYTVCVDAGRSPDGARLAGAQGPDSVESVRELPQLRTRPLADLAEAPELPTAQGRCQQDSVLGDVGREVVVGDGDGDRQSEASDLRCGVDPATYDGDVLDDRGVAVQDATIQRLSGGACVEQSDDGLQPGIGRGVQRAVLPEVVELGRVPCEEQQSFDRQLGTDPQTDRVRPIPQQDGADFPCTTYAPHAAGRGSQRHEIRPGGERGHLAAG